MGPPPGLAGTAWRCSTPRAAQSRRSWSAHDRHDRLRSIPNAVVRVDPPRTRRTPRSRWPRDPPVARGLHRSGHQIAYGAGSGVGDRGERRGRVDRRVGSPRVIADRCRQALAVAFGQGGAWVLGEHIQVDGVYDGVEATSWRLAWCGPAVAAGLGVGHVVGHGSCSLRSISSLRASGCAISAGQSVLGSCAAPS